MLDLDGLLEDIAHNAYRESQRLDKRDFMESLIKKLKRLIKYIEQSR